MQSKLEGAWQMVRGELAGEAAPELVVQHTVVTLTNDAYQVSFDGEISDRGTYAVTTAPTHSALVLRGVVGPNAGRTIPCIFQLMGDRLRICYGLDGVLPVEFATRAGEERFLVTYRRVPISGGSE